MVPEALEDVVAVLESCPAFADATRGVLGGLAARSELVYVTSGGSLPDDVTGRPLVVERGALLIRDAAGRTVDLVDEHEFYVVTAAPRTEGVGPVLAVVLPDEAVDVAWPVGPLRRHGRDTATVDNVQTAPVRSIMSAPAITATAEETCREVAGRMRLHRISSIIVQRADDVFGIVTDRDLRDLVAAGRPVDAPVGGIASFPVRGIAAERPVFEALVEMLTQGIHHLAVTEKGHPLGVVTSSDLLELRTRSPLYLRKAVDRAADVKALAEALKDLPATVGALLAAGTSGTDAGRVVAAVTDRVVGRLLSLADDSLGPAPAPYGWIAFGSQARQEQTLDSDQDSGLLLPDGLGAQEDGWFADLARWMTDALERCGYRRCPGGVMASEERWRAGLTVWQQRFESWMTTPTEQHLLGAEIAFDMRRVGGGLDPGQTLQAVIRNARTHGLFLAHLAHQAVAHRPPLGFRGRFAVDRSGEHAGTFDVKRGALLPIADLARLHTLARGGSEVSTDDRLAGAADAGRVSRDLADTLRAGYDLALRLRFEQHLRRHADGLPPDDYVDPADLPPLVRSQLREVFKATRLAQETVQRLYATPRL